jgi:hypothetical protein
MTDEVDRVLWVVESLVVFEDMLVAETFKPLWASSEVDLRKRLGKEMRNGVSQGDVHRMKVRLSHLVEDHSSGIGEERAFTIPLGDQTKGLSFNERTGLNIPSRSIEAVVLSPASESEEP